MIITEFYSTQKDGTELFYIYSDQNYYIYEGDNISALYIDVITSQNFPENWHETNQLIKKPRHQATIKDYQDALGEFGVKTK